MIWRRRKTPGTTNTLLLLSLGFLLVVAPVTATIEGDKKIQEPDPLPAKPQPATVVPKISELEELPSGVGVERKIPAAAVVPDTSATKDESIGSGAAASYSSRKKIANDDDEDSKSTTAGKSSKDAVPAKGPSTPSSSFSRESVDDLHPGSAPKSSRDTLISESHSFFLAFLMIIFSEIGDKTFLIAALMAMKHPRLLVFSAAFSSLIVMTVLSALLGHAVPTLIPKWLTNWIAAGLFLVFGLKMLSEGLKMDKGTDSVKEEMKEVEQELIEKEAEARGRSGSVASMVEEGRGHGSRGYGKAHPRRATASPSMSDSEDEEFSDALRQEGAGQGVVKTVSDGVQNLAGLLLSPAWVQTFVMTFLGEWGDRSQIATIAMAAGQDYWFVIMGSIVGHGCCTAGAVVGGKLLAERISVRNVTLGGSAAFLVFSFIYMLEAIYA